MDAMEHRVEEPLAAFERTRDPARLEQALERIEAAEADPAAATPQRRKLALQQRLRFFAALDRSLDPTWDPAKLPVKGAAAPPSHRGIVYGTGEVDPADIADPAERAEYVKALKASKDYAKEYDVQFQLRRLEQRALQFLQRLLEERYGDASSDRNEFDELLAAAPIGEPRKRQLRALMPKAR